MAEKAISAGGLRAIEGRIGSGQKRLRVVSFARRGHTAALAEARLAALTTNLLRLFSTDTRAASPA